MKYLLGESLIELLVKVDVFIVRTQVKCLKNL